MSSLNLEKQIIISPQLATTIGLEEAILFSIFSDFETLSSNTGWKTLHLSKLQTLLPFWSNADIKRIAQNLHEKGVIQLELGAESMKFNVAIDHTISTTKAQTNHSTTNRPTVKGAKLLSTAWHPEPALLQSLTMNHGIPETFCLEQLEDFLLYWTEREQVSHSWSSKFRQHVLRQWRHTEIEQNALKQSKISKTWRPTEDALDIMTKSGVNAQFIEDCIPEFILYWQEKNDSGGNWNTRFIAHIRRQWASFRSATTRDTLPSHMHSDWQPSEEVFDILKLANIEPKFAKNLIAEFILYWKDSGEAQRSWNTKFLQHIKFHWAKQHQLNTEAKKHEEQQNPHKATQQKRSTRERSLLEDLQDRSWAS